jgi:hypothetical protein
LLSDPSLTIFIAHSSFFSDSTVNTCVPPEVRRQQRHATRRVAHSTAHLAAAALAQLLQPDVVLAIDNHRPGGRGAARRGETTPAA